MPASLEVRVMRVQIERNGFRTRCLWIATTCTDAVRYPAEQLAGLYYRRYMMRALILQSAGQQELGRISFKGAVAVRCNGARADFGAAERRAKFGLLTRGAIQALSVMRMLKWPGS